MVNRVATVGGFTAEQRERVAVFFETLARLRASSPMAGVGVSETPARFHSTDSRYFARVKGKRSESLKHRANRRKAGR
jgi:hypothetical protein